MLLQLNDVIERTIDYRGKTPSKVKVGIPIISAANVKKGKLILDGKCIDRDVYKKWATRGFIKPGDILITTEAPVGEIAQVPGDQTYLISRRVFALQINKNVADEKFIYYLLLTEGVIKYFESIAHGATVPRIFKDEVLKMELNLPPLPIQQKIASILTAYDDLIENNNQRIKLLEEMAEEIYKEWFVRLRFPGYQNTKIVDGVPEGWEKKRLRKCLEYYIGGGWGEDEPNGKTCAPAFVIRGTDIPNCQKGILNYGMLRYHTKSNLSSRRCIPNDIIFEVSGGTEEQSLGRCVFITKTMLDRFEHDVICASFCKLLRVNNQIVSSFYINSVLNKMYNTGEIKVYQVQSTGISNYQFEDFIDATKILIPTFEVQGKFEEILSPMLDEIQVLGGNNRLLQQTRDLLLPRLMSGKLSVENLELETVRKTNN